MANDDEDNTWANAAFAAIKEAVLNADTKADPETPRDVWWLRWLKFVSLIFTLAVIVGLGFFGEGYLEEYHQAQRSYDAVVANAYTGQDTIKEMKFRFWLGAGIGGGLGVIYVVRCFIRKVDP